jgi:hypothetical protein
MDLLVFLTQVDQDGVDPPKAPSVLISLIDFLEMTGDGVPVSLLHLTR